MNRLLNRLRGHVEQPEEENRPDMPLRTKWLLTACDKCHRVAWFGLPIPHLVVSEEDVEQYVRINMGRGSSRRRLVNAPLRLTMSKPSTPPWRCPCGCTDGKIASTAGQILGLTLLKMRANQ